MGAVKPALSSSNLIVLVIFQMQRASLNPINLGWLALKKCDLCDHRQSFPQIELRVIETSLKGRLSNRTHDTVDKPNRPSGISCSPKQPTCTAKRSATLPKISSTNVHPMLMQS
jgi:hypothetical protein